MLERSSSVSMAFLETQLIGDDALRQELTSLALDTLGIDFQVAGVTLWMNTKAQLAETLAFGQVLRCCQVIRAYTICC